MRRWFYGLLACWANVVWAGQIQQLEVLPELSGVRLTFTLSPGTQHQDFQMQNPDRLVLDLLNTQRGSFDLDKSRLSTPLLAWRVAQREANLRFTFTLDGPSKPLIYKLKSPDGKAERLIVELRAQDAASKPPQSVTAPSTSHAGKPEPSVQGAAELPKPVDAKPVATKKTPSQPVAAVAIMADAKVVSAAEAEAKPAESSQVRSTIKGRKIVVAIDAGHGGKDTGALGAGGVREKDVVLGIARELAEQLSRDSHYKVALIRSGDTFVPLKGRRDKARKLKADLFVSIHADAFSTSEATGASVFALSPRGATSEMARFLAQSENNSDLAGSVGGVNLEDKDEVLAGVLVDLSMTATLANSLDVGGRVLRELGKVTRLHNRQVEQAGFVVLKSPDVPSILVETGFISNPNEAAQLSNQAHRQRLARAVANGVRNYFALAGPAGDGVRVATAEPEAISTRFSASPDTPKIDSRAQTREVVSSLRAQAQAQNRPRAASKTPHTVVVGDTLEKIAQQYGVSQKSILAANNMATTIVKTGQRLKIPVN